MLQTLIQEKLKDIQINMEINTNQITELGEQIKKIQKSQERLEKEIKFQLEVILTQLMDITSGKTPEASEAAQTIMEKLEELETRVTNLENK